jgi:hypothetical protein
MKKFHPTFINATESWMRSQPAGYRDFERYTGRRLTRGRLVCSQHIVRFAPPLGALPLRLPSDFLFGMFGKAINASVPTYLVVDAAIAGHVLRPFPKSNGMRVWVYTRGEHPPPHIHIETPLGNPLRRRCIWPSSEHGEPSWSWPLSMYKGDPPLESREHAKLRHYLRAYGDEIWAKLKSVYPNQHLARPAVSAV